MNRPIHDFWEEGGYERRKEGNKIVAYCLICKKTLSNSAKTRLQTHRNVCRNETDWSSSASQNLQLVEKSISTDDNGNVIELENIQSASIAVDAATSSSDQRISEAKVIAIGAPDSSEVPILPFDFDNSTVAHQNFSDAVSTFILPV
ncbi:hypothetical protein DMN91_008413 [Ooceraea biroi]|uniref:Uncharacterized protein n=1 Tax=Ooceraea biroi TaxID=2015173 RepID=A0A3L8DHD4_OOCBI|nr:hypothetical protein DMN91_008413 [Ooceraea biroi]